MSRKRIIGKKPSAIKNVTGRKTTKSEALGVSQHPIGREALFTPTKGGGLMRIGGEHIVKALPKEQRITLHDLRMAAISIPLAVGSAYVGYKSSKKIARALRKRSLGHNWKDLKEDAKKNVMHSLDLLENVVEEKKSPILFRKRKYPRGGGYYTPKSGRD